ncbi:super-infection exclusion protein B [Citrobacter portucalensis]|uniref:super-infection exclusion protein B n=1 Tax=Citrobacter portucalensis TaxID=1639133 RepID=UPI00206A8567|nr:MAG TPA: Super-infection exclusion protein B [Caudoviricetes sp.]
MMDVVTGIVDVFRKIPTVFLIAITCVLGLILFLPETLASKVAVDGFRREYRIYIGPVFLLAISFLVAKTFLFFNDIYAYKQIQKSRIAWLGKLTSEEKGYLAPYIFNGLNTQQCGPEDGVMGGLVAKGITYRSSNIGSLVDGFAYNLQPWAREHLEKNHHLLDGASGRAMTPSERLGFRRRF